MILLLVSGCSATGEEPRASFTEEFSIAAALDELPASLPTGHDSQTPYYQITNYHGLARAAGLSPVEPGDLDAFIEFSKRTASHSSDLCATWPEAANADHPMYGQHSDFLQQAFQAELTELTELELGASWIGARSTAEATVGTRAFTIATGVSVRDDLEGVAPGVSTLGTGADFSSGERTQLRRFGRPLRIGDRGDAIAVSGLTRPVEEWMNGGHVVAASSNASLMALAEHLDDHGVLSASLGGVSVLSRRLGGGPGSENPHDTIAHALSFGIGWGQDEQGIFGVLVLAYPDVDAAELHLESVRNRWSYSLDVITPSDFATVESLVRVDAELVAVVRFKHNQCAGMLDAVPIVLGFGS